MNETVAWIALGTCALAAGCTKGSPDPQPACQGTVCGAACVNTQTDPANCGQCGVACQAGSACTAGRCVSTCQGTLCGGACVDTQTDPANCGQCGVVCVGGSACAAGRCGYAPPKAAAPSAGCGTAGVPTGRQQRTIDVTDLSGVTRTRSYELLVPADYAPATSLALVYVFHAADGTSADAFGWGLQDAPGAASSAIFLFPQGIDFTENGTDYGIGWNEHCDGYDMPFFDAMTQTIASTYCVDASRVFAAGFSWGADFANNLGCCRGSAVRAVAPASGADGNYNLSCGATFPAFRLTYAANDGAYPQSEFDAVVARYRSAHGCAATSRAVTPSPCVAYDGCDAPVLTCTYPSGGHALPPNWANDVWAWLSLFR